MPRLHVNGQPYLVRQLRSQIVKPQGRQEADDTFGGSLARLDDGPVFGDLTIGERVETALHPLENASGHKIAEVLSRNAELLKVACPLYTVPPKMADNLVLRFAGVGAS